MAKSQTTTTEQNIWVGGLTLDHFLVPSKPTEVASAAKALVEVTLDLSDASSGGPTPGEDSGEDFSQTLLAALADWQKSDDDLDCAVRKTMWPQPDPSQYRPAATETDRFEGNLAAIRTMQHLKAISTAPDADQTATLLKYCGWGGLARMLGPTETLPNGTGTLRAELEQLVTPDDFKSMKASVTSAYYTDPMLVSSIWKLIQRLGFNGGRICEPSVGAGHFLAGMPREIALRSDVTAVELDSITAQIAETIYGPHGVQVHACGLENAKIPHNFFDLVVGNVPFGQYKTGDTSRSPYSDWSIHNWFLAKSLELVRPGGLVVVLTSRHSLDSRLSSSDTAWCSITCSALSRMSIIPRMRFRAVPE